MAALVATGYNGKTVNVGDQVSILGAVLTITGSAPSTASVVVTEQFGVYTPTVQANDCTSAQDTAGTGQNKNGKLFTTGDRVAANGVVVSGTGVTPTNKQATPLVVKLDNSGLSITVSAGSCVANGA